MAKARTSPSTKRAKKAKRCTRGTVSFTTKRGKTVSFQGRMGETCGPRPKPKTGHLGPYKREFARQAKACKGRSRAGFLKCMSRSKGALVAR